ncbi:MAG: KamA family radical SAM protein [Kiritimatiellae bacterium]|nr:KamA family radical SAM protein [Kiritimatiellia bacterium]
MATRDWNNWKWQLRHAQRIGDLDDVEARYPSFITPYGKSLLQYRAIRLQSLPDRRELIPEPETSADPFHETTVSAKCYGVKQRFPDRVLLMVNNHCAMNCRHCTRKGLLADAEVIRTEDQLAQAIEYIRKHPRIRDVLLSGGDPLLLDDSHILTFVNRIAALPQIDVVRLCTRVLSTLPMRITNILVRKLAVSRKVWVNTQFNCAEELTPDAVSACSKFADAGIPVSCQTVLLKGVNDSVAKLFALCSALQRARVRPYYVFVCDPITGISHFRVPLDKAKRLEQQLAERIGGLALPRFVADIPGSKRKIPIQLADNFAARSSDE